MPDVDAAIPAYRRLRGQRIICELCGAHTHAYPLRADPVPGNCMLGAGDIAACEMQEHMDERAWNRARWREKYPEFHDAEGNTVGITRIFKAEGYTDDVIRWMAIWSFVPRHLLIEAMVRERMAANGATEAPDV